MSKLIERYVYDVTRRLPQKMREDVSNELRANIYEMLGENQGEDEIKNVLYSLGSPRNLASNYSGSSRHLISSEWITDYLYVLKIVLIVFGALGLIFGLINSFETIESESIIGMVFEVFGKILGNIVGNLLSSFAVVTLIFIIIDRYSDAKSEWRTEDLPQLPKTASVKISRAGSIAGLVFTTIFGSIWIYILYYNNLYNVWFGNEGWIIGENFFNVDYTRMFVIPFIIVISLEIIVYSFKIKYTQWNFTLVTLNSVAKLFGVILAIVFIMGSNLLNQEFVAKTGNVLEISSNDLNRYIEIAKYVLVSIIVLANLTEVISDYFTKYRYIEIKIK